MKQLAPISRLKWCACGASGVSCYFIEIIMPGYPKHILSPHSKNEPDTERLHDTAMEALWDAVGKEGV